MLVVAGVPKGLFLLAGVGGVAAGLGLGSGGRTFKVDGS